MNTDPVSLGQAISWAAAQLPPTTAASLRTGAMSAGEHVCAALVAALFTENVNGLGALGPGVDGVVVWPAVPGGRIVFDGVISGATLRVVGSVWWECGSLRLRVSDPAVLLRLAVGAGGHVGIEMVNSAIHVALARARVPSLGTDVLTAARAAGADAGALLLERLACDGHNMHPCGRSRVGMSVPDVLRFDVGGEDVRLPVVALRRDVHVGDDVGTLLGLGPADPGYVFQPVHPWQLREVIMARHGQLVRSGALRVVPDMSIAASATASMRTLVTSGGPVVKVSLDVQITSTRRSMSLATVRNGPAVSDLVAGLLAGTGVMLAEYAGAGVRLPGAERDITALLRRPLAGEVAAGEVAVPAMALPAMCPFTRASVVNLLVAASGWSREHFLAEYARVLLAPVLRLAAAGVGVEAHLQNCVPVFRDGRPVRIVFRDLGGVRLHQGRLAAGGHRLNLWPGSITSTNKVADMHAKVIYTVFANHLSAIVEALKLGERGWKIINEAVHTAYEPLRRNRRLAKAAAEDLTAITTNPWTHKALLTMRLREVGDTYVPINNPLAS